FHLRVPLSVPTRRASDLQRGLVEETLNRVEIPKDLHVTELPEKYSQETEFGSYSVEVLPDDQGGLIYKRRLFLRAGTYPKELYRSEEHTSELQSRENLVC